MFSSGIQFTRDLRLLFSGKKRVKTLEDLIIYIVLDLQHGADM